MGDTGARPAQQAGPGDILRFDHFTLDPITGTLMADARSVILRPKTAAVLRFLLERAGEVVTRETILATVWPGVTVTDDSLTQCISEIRRALGAAGPGMLRTLPRRGYILSATVERRVRPPEAAPAPQAAVVAAPPMRGGGAGPRAMFLAVLAGGALLLVAQAFWPSVPVTAAAQPTASPRAQAAVLLQNGSQIMYGGGDFVERMRRSIGYFRQAVALDPGNVVAAARATFAHTNLLIDGRSPDRMHELAEADRFAALAEAAAPGHPMALHARAAVLRQQGALAEALLLYDRVGQSPDEVTARASAALMRMLLGQPEAAIPALRAVLAESPTHPWVGSWRVHLGQAQLFAGEGDHGAAALDTTPMQVSAMRGDERLSYRAAALWQTGRRDEARMILHTLRERRPELGLDWLRARRLSAEPGHVAQFEARLIAPLAAAGLLP